MYLLLLDSVPMVSRSANGSLKRLDVYSMTSFKTHQRDSDTVLIQGTCREGEKICHGCHQFIFDFSCTRKTLIMFPCLNSIYVHSNTQDIKKKKNPGFFGSHRIQRSLATQISSVVSLHSTSKSWETTKPALVMRTSTICDYKTTPKR